MACACSPPVSPASAHVTPRGRPMRPPYVPISWTDGQQSPRFKGPTGHAPVLYWRRLRCRPGSIESHFAGSHASPLTAADDVSVSAGHSLALSLWLSLCLCLQLFSPRVCSSILCALRSVQCSRRFCVVPNEGPSQQEQPQDCSRPTMATPTSPTSPTPIKRGTCPTQAAEVQPFGSTQTGETQSYLLPFIISHHTRFLTREYSTDRH